MSWRGLEDVCLRRLHRHWSRCARSILKITSEEEVERRLQAIFKTSLSRQMFVGAEKCLVFAITNLKLVTV